MRAFMKLSRLCGRDLKLAALRRARSIKRRDALRSGVTNAEMLGFILKMASHTIHASRPPGNSLNDFDVNVPRRVVAPRPAAPAPAPPKIVAPTSIFTPRFM